MTQLDLFNASSTVAKQAEKLLLRQGPAKEENEIAESEKQQSVVSLAEQAAENAVTETTAETLPQTETEPAAERNGNIVFEDSRITVKIKAKPAAKKEEPKSIDDVTLAKSVEQATSEKDGVKEPSVDKPAKVEPKKSIVTKQPKSEYSNSLREKLDKVKTSIKEGLLKDNAAEKRKKEKETRIPQKRGRKSLKEIDTEVDLVEIPDDEILFQKQYYSISEVAGWFRVNTSLLRFWENEFDILKPRKNRKGDRLFRPEDVKNLQIIHQLLRQRKYSIEGAKEYLKTNKNKADTQMQLTNTLQKFKSFLLELKANLQQ